MAINSGWAVRGSLFFGDFRAPAASGKRAHSFYCRCYVRSAVSRTGGASTIEDVASRCTMGLAF